MKRLILVCPGGGKKDKLTGHRERRMDDLGDVLKAKLNAGSREHSIVILCSLARNCYKSAEILCESLRLQSVVSHNVLDFNCESAAAFIKESGQEVVIVVTHLQYVISLRKHFLLELDPSCTPPRIEFHYGDHFDMDFEAGIFTHVRSQI